jgi:hypothetical protein
VGLSGFEPLTPALSAQCSNQLSYRPATPQQLKSDRKSSPPNFAPHIGAFCFFQSRAPVCATKARDLSSEISRKEVIQPHLPVQLPCYDFVPVTSPTFDGSLLTVRIPASGVASSHDVTGGVCKARERIHRTIADARLLATPASCRRVAACNPN